MSVIKSIASPPTRSESAWSLKSSGVLLLNDCLPHTVQTIATFTRHQVGTVERALKIFQEFGLVEILTDGAYYMSDLNSFFKPMYAF